MMMSSELSHGLCFANLCNTKVVENGVQEDKNRPCALRLLNSFLFNHTLGIDLCPAGCPTRVIFTLANPAVWSGTENHGTSKDRVSEWCRSIYALVSIFSPRTETLFWIFCLVETLKPKIYQTGQMR